MYIHEWNKVGHRSFQRLLSSQGGSVLRRVRREDAAQTAFTGGLNASRQPGAASATGEGPTCCPGDRVAPWAGRLRCSAGCQHVSRRTAPFQPWACSLTAMSAQQPGARLGKGLSRGGAGIWGQKVSFGARGFAPDSALFMYEQCCACIWCPFQHDQGDTKISLASGNTRHDLEKDQFVFSLGFFSLSWRSALLRQWYEFCGTG